ncbi:lysoplasmalogenase [Ekhidna sp.]|uniref:lysoplasmalogenase n=1 Tax=Ekhidna sp. TaxID=2608089 RepID=UPI00329A14D3
MSRYVLWIYLLVSIANLIAKVIPSEELNQYTKPLLMPLLILYVYKSSLGKTTARVLILCVALLFSWLGDVVLMYQEDPTFFMIGIGLFLIAQVTYIFILYKSTYQKPTLNLLQIAPFIIYAILLFYILIPAGDFTIPIIVYGMVILTMAIIARLREGHTVQESYKFAFWGSLFFLLSDSILAINAFYSAIPLAGVWIMSTYCAAQFLLVKGLLKHVE